MQDSVNILMVDDQPGKLLSYEAILSELGENLIKAGSGREALELLLKHEIAVVLMDVSMPDIDGFQLADMIRQHPRFQKTAIIFISGVHFSEIDQIRGYERGAVDYISVPVIPELLRAKVSVFAELHRKTRQLEKLNRELEQRVAERTEELRESESQFRTLANSIPQLAWIAGPDGAVSWYNQRWYDFTGLTARELEGLGWHDVHHPQHKARVLLGLQQSWTSGEPWEDTFPLRGSDGEYRWFLSRAVPIHDSHGRVVRWFGTSTDISRQIQAEEQIRALNTELEQRLIELETIMQVLPVGVAVAHDPECRLITGNAAFSEMLGMRQGDNLSKTAGPEIEVPYRIYHNGLELPPQQLPLQRAALTGLPVGSAEIEIRRDDGQRIHALGSATPLFDASGNVRGVVGAFYDVSDRKRMDHMLRERAELLELASEAVMVRDVSGVLQFWNSGAEALYGWKREEILGKDVHEVLRTRFPVPRAQVEAELAGAGRWEGNLVQYTREGDEIVVASRKALKIGPDGAGSSAVLEINRDITTQLLAEEALRKAERLAGMGRVAGIIAHEINNPLEAITNAFYLLKDHPSLDEEARYYARLAEQELQRVEHITRQTLSFYRESQQAVPVSIPEVLDDVLELQARRLRLSGITLDKKYETTGMVQGFPVELKQVFLNLIGNSIQAMPEGGRLRVRISETSHNHGHRRSVRVSVSDTGTGIPRELAKRIFEPFFTTKSTKGTGLGLWISRGIIQKYDGHIGFRSLRLNGGCVTCFSVLMPANDSAEPRELTVSLAAR